MGKIKVRKKLRKKKSSNFSNYVLVALSILFIFLMFVSFFNDSPKKFKLEPRSENVEEIKEKDSAEFETVGWVRVQGTNIDYPVINVLDYEYGHPVGVDSYAWNMNKKVGFQKKIDISGHNIMNLSVNPIKKDESFIYFEELMNYVYPEFVEENQFIQLNIDGKDYLYQVFSVNILGTYEVEGYLDLEKKDEIRDFLKFLKRSTLYNFDLVVDENDNLLCLYTCTRFYGAGRNVNLAVVAKLVDEDEKAKLVSFEKTERYDYVKDIMNGGVEDE